MGPPAALTAHKPSTFFVQQGDTLAERAHLTQQAAFYEGEKILQRFLSHAATSPSAFTTKKDLENNCWIVKPSVPQVFSPAFEKPFTDLRLTPGPYRNPKQTALQEKSFLNIKNHIRNSLTSSAPATASSPPISNVNPRSKIVIDAQLRKPPRRLTKPEIDEGVPKVANWADVVWIQSAEACKAANEDPTAA
ncbi:MAG: hypothetical protein Q9179_004501 [Wetmoreana sp. 5 TL-2023]